MKQVGFILCNISGAGGQLRAVLFGRGQDELNADPKLVDFVSV